MNVIEKQVYNIVKSTPWVKFLLRNCYQSFFDMLPRKKDFFAVPYDYKEGFFGGFHDVDSFSADCTKLLANQINFDLRMPKKGEGLNLGYFDVENDSLGKYHLIGVSYAWNYHKGCRLQWISDNKVIFNSAIEDRLVSKIINVDNRETENVIDYPIDSISPDKLLATSFSYERLERCMPGYGYPYRDDGFINESTPKETGLFLINIKNNNRKLLVAIADLVSDLNDVEYSSGKYMHYVTHSEFSLSGRYVSFLHRWFEKGKDSRKRWTRVVIYDLINASFVTLPTQLSGSHYVWNEKEQILLSCILNQQTFHVLFDVKDINNYQIISPEKLNSDGHQSFIDSLVFVTDTYPNRQRMSKIYKVDIEKISVEEIVSIYSPKEFQTKFVYKHIACDLHPRVSKNGKYLCFDSSRTGKRSIYIIKL